MSDSHYLEADGEHTAGGRRMAAYERYRCQSHRIAGYSNVFDCALPIGHDGSHESAGGSSWDEPDAWAVVTAYQISGGRWQAEGANYHPRALLARRARTSVRASALMLADLTYYRRRGHRNRSQVLLRVLWRVKRAVSKCGSSR